MADVSPYAFNVNVLPAQLVDIPLNDTVAKLNDPAFAAFANTDRGVAVIQYESQAEVTATP